jgi:23S rRNA (cytidine2498-2'-O)-methyltransferase
MHVLVSAEDSAPFLQAESQRDFPGIEARLLAPDLIAGDWSLAAGFGRGPLAFCRQWLPEAQARAAGSIREWSQTLLAEIESRLPAGQPWRLHVAPHYGGATAGQHRCRLVRESLREILSRRNRVLLRALQEEPLPFTPAVSLAQLLLTGPETGFVSVWPAPGPFDGRSLLSPFPKGDVPVAVDKAAPSRAFAKLVEAELRLGRRIAKGESCADLGASPGSWSYMALGRGARVLAVDRAPLRADLMRHARLEFRRGDAFAFAPAGPVDWLLCDVIAAPERSVALLLDWLRRRWMKRFVVTIKFKGQEDYAKLDTLKRELPALTEEFFLTRLCANKNEVCAFGTAR